ncbi:MAG: beta-N-acetylhexosaminidase [Candidatus Paceibacterota bacterium]|jgi:beta-N-acetylhexosaminidase
MQNLLIKNKIIIALAFLFIAGAAAFFLFPQKTDLNGNNDSQTQEQNENLTEKNIQENEQVKKQVQDQSETTVQDKTEEKNQNQNKDQDEALKEKIGQMLIVGFRGTKIAAKSVIGDQIKNLNLGGVVLFDYDNPSKSFPRNITSPAQTKQLITDLQSFSLTPLFIAVDAEGGLVNRLKEKYGFIDLPSAQTLGEQNDLAKTQQTASELGKELKQLGFNIDLAPVVDVNINPQNPIIGKMERSFSDDPEKVASQALAFIDGLHENNIISVIKHFPGHGSSQNDSHLGLVDVTKTYQQKELIPFQKIIEQNQADMVMTAHIMDTSIDPDYPATLSPLFLQNILRNKLGYQGVIFSDDMQMGAITKNYGFEDALVRAINAGCDLIGLSNNNDSYDENIASETIDIIAKAVKDGRISEKTIDGSYNRIMNLKKKFEMIK